LEDPDRDGRIILNWISKKWNGDMDWIDLAQNGESLRAVVNAIMSLPIP